MEWRGKFYVDLALPFGLRSAPFIYNSVANMLEWILRNNYAVLDFLHYLDDYFTLGPPNSEKCARNLATIQEVCAHVGVPLAPAFREVYRSYYMHRLFGHIEVDSVEICARLPDDKLTKLKHLISTGQGKRHSTRREL